MVEVLRSGRWWLVVKDNEDLAWFVHSLDANRFAIAMLHDGLASSVTLPSGVKVEL
jgi:hypothetical protein